MRPELAKELRAAGFPGTQACQHEPSGVHLEGKIYPRDMCYFREPTLSELIGACGDGVRLNIAFGVSVATKFDTASDSKTIWPILDVTEGTTPEEAFALLWLALNPPADSG